MKKYKYKFIKEGIKLGFNYDKRLKKLKVNGMSLDNRGGNSVKRAVE